MSYYGERKRNSVVLLSSSHTDTALTNDETIKPIVILNYHKQKDGVDMFDQNLEFLLPPKDWALNTPDFFNRIDAVINNAFILMQKNG